VSPVAGEAATLVAFFLFAAAGGCRSRNVVSEPHHFSPAYATVLSLLPEDNKPMPSSKKHAFTNRLIHEKSPYLLQHARNPVDWYPWGKEAFEKARKENKPIFLSIGYSTCHWCHVMEKESFEDGEVAALLNKNFVAVKVDREERPDIDKVYMDACMALTGSGGWPLTIMITPDGKPFFAGTYFPKEGMWGRPGLVELLTEIHGQWQRNPDTIAKSGGQITRAVRERRAAGGAGLGVGTVQEAFDQLHAQFDATYGGFGAAPKFPMPHSLSFLLRWWKRSGDIDALAMVEKTLDAMARGGMYDHAGFGFHRYSVDRKWLVPHFEKMLYDQALLAIAYIEAFQATGNEGYARIAEQVLQYVLRDMTAPEGGFYTAEDADSEGEEGKFYVWTPQGVEEVLGEEAGKLFCRLYGVTERGNFEKGKSILNIEEPLETFAKSERIDCEDLKAVIEESRGKLFNAREARVHPHKDDKILADWNGLMITALAKGAQALGERKYAKAAAGAADFILEEMRRPDGRLLHRYRDGEAAVPAYLDDYAFLVWGLIELYEATFEIKYLEAALSLNTDMIRIFWDGEEGGLFFSGEGNEELFVKRKELHDGSVPSGNSVAALNFLRLGRMTSNEALEKKAAELMKTFSGTVNGSPAAHTQFLVALDFLIGPTREIVIAGDPEREDTGKMLRAVRERFLPRAVVILHPVRKEGKEIRRVLPFIKGREPVQGKARAYVCQNYTCVSPTTDLEHLEKLLDHPEQTGKAGAVEESM
jgi:uncharacterized protein YyaL (SSP411 family)